MAHRLPTTDMRLSIAKPRTLVLCFDGTTNVYDNSVSQGCPVSYFEH
jgi:uncharacterized protein (DUF2235 family)